MNSIVCCIWIYIHDTSHVYFHVMIYCMYSSYTHYIASICYTCLYSPLQEKWQLTHSIQHPHYMLYIYIYILYAFDVIYRVVSPLYVIHHTYILFHIISYTYYIYIPLYIYIYIYSSYPPWYPRYIPTPRTEGTLRALRSVSFGENGSGAKIFVRAPCWWPGWDKNWLVATGTSNK